MSKVQHCEPGLGELEWNRLPRAAGSARSGGEAQVIRLSEHRSVPQPSAGSLSRPPAAGSNVIAFRRRGHLANRQTAPQLALEAMAKNNEYALRMLENGIAGAATLALIAAGYWALSTLAVLS